MLSEHAGLIKRLKSAWRATNTSAGHSHLEVILSLQSTRMPCKVSSFTSFFFFFLHILSLHKPAGEFAMVSNLTSNRHWAVLGSVAVFRVALFSALLVLSLGLTLCWNQDRDFALACVFMPHKRWIIHVVDSHMNNVLIMIHMHI